MPKKAFAIRQYCTAASSRNLFSHSWNRHHLITSGSFNQDVGRGITGLLEGFGVQSFVAARQTPSMTMLNNQLHVVSVNGQQ